MFENIRTILISSRVMTDNILDGRNADFREFFDIGIGGVEDGFIEKSGHIGMEGNENVVRHPGIFWKLKDFEVSEVIPENIWDLPLF